MSKQWSGKAPTGLHIEYDNDLLTGDNATMASIRRAVEDKTVVTLTATGPDLVVTNDDHAAIMQQAIDTWRDLLTFDQFLKMEWTNPPFVIPDPDDNLAY